MNLDWLERYTIPDSGIPEWASIHYGDGLAVVTDSRCLLAVPAPDEWTPLAPFSGKKADRNVALRAMLREPPPASAMVTDLMDLWRWLDHLEREACPQCRGSVSGRHTEDGFCAVCDGQGWLTPFREPDAPDTLTVCGVPVDPWRLCWWLAGELEEYGTRCCVWLTGTAKVPTVVIAGDSWRLLCASLDREMNPSRHRAYLPGAGLWWQYRRCPVSRLTAADWAAERGADVFDLFGEGEP